MRLRKLASVPNPALKIRAQWRPPKSLSSHGPGNPEMKSGMKSDVTNQFNHEAGSPLKRAIPQYANENKTAKYIYTNPKNTTARIQAHRVTMYSFFKYSTIFL
jgi:hypothetical protein